MNVGNNIKSPLVQKYSLLSENGNLNTINNDKKGFEELIEEVTNVDEENSDTLGARASRNVYGGQTTDKGTHIVQPGEDMDKDAFLKILATQMANQDPTQPQDGTEYVSQFAQFAAMEQMTNLNKTMSGYAAESLIGKGVMLNSYDYNGRPITGIVRSVAQNGSTSIVGVEYLNEKNEYVIGEFKKDNIATVIEVPDNRMDYINNNMAMLVGSSMLNKDIEFIVNNNEDIEDDGDKIDGDNSVSGDDEVKDKDEVSTQDDKVENGDSSDEDSDEIEDVSPQYETKFGRVESVVVENYMIQLRVSVEGSDEMETVTLDRVIRVDGDEYIQE